MAGTSTSYTLCVVNNGIFGVVGASITDALPAGIATATWTCADGLNNGSCDVASGTASNGNAIDGARVDLPVNGTVIFTLTLQIPANREGVLSNTVVVTPPNTASDTTPANNTATDADNSRVDLSITKTNTPGVNGNVDQANDRVISGTTTTYQIRVTNVGPNRVSGALVRDTPTAGLNCPAGNPLTITGNGVPAGSFTVADLTGGGIALDTLASGQTALLSFTCMVL